MHELNLLPPERRRHLQQQSRFIIVRRSINRLIIGLAALTLCAGAVAGIIWLQTQFIPRSDFLPTTLKKYQTVRSTIDERNRTLEAITALERDRIVWTELLPTLLQALPPETFIERIQADVSRRRLTIAGRAPSRSALVVLEERIQDLPWTKQVTSPPGNLLIRENPTFTLEIELAAPLPTPTPPAAPASSPRVSVSPSPRPTP
jgi:Tfp pilus assembly protein PilN